VIETKRLLLRPLTLGDVDELIALHDHLEVARFLKRLERPPAEERLRADVLLGDRVVVHSVDRGDWARNPGAGAAVWAVVVTRLRVWRMARRCG
jgi:hypothetical protein